MRKLTLLIILNLLILKSFAQVSFGIKGGLNISGQTREGQSPSLDQYHKGIVIGGFSNIVISKYFSVQPELLYSNQGAFVEKSTNYITFPLLLKYKSNKVLSFLVGAQYGYLINSIYKSAIYNTTEFDMKMDYNNNYIGLILGSELKLSNKFAIDVRYGFSLNDLSNKDYYKQLNTSAGIFLNPNVVYPRPAYLSNKYFGIALNYRIY